MLGFKSRVYRTAVCSADWFFLLSVLSSRRSDGVNASERAPQSRPFFNGGAGSVVTCVVRLNVSLIFRARAGGVNGTDHLSTHGHVIGSLLLECRTVEIIAGLCWCVTSNGFSFGPIPAMQKLFALESRAKLCLKM
jgi:hypothetical protein